MSASKEFLEMMEMTKLSPLLADLVPLFMEVHRSRELWRRTSASITFIDYQYDGNGGYDDGIIVECSDVKAFHYGLTREEVIGNSNLKIMPDKAAAAKARLDDIWVMENETVLTDIIEEITHPNGQKVYVSVTKSPRYHFKCEKMVCGVTNIARDITLRVQAEQKLQGVISLVKKDVFTPLLEITTLITRLDDQEHAEIKNTIMGVLKHLEQLQQQL